MNVVRVNIFKFTRGSGMQRELCLVLLWPPAMLGLASLL